LPASCDVGEQRKLKIAAGEKLLLQANWQKKFVNGELVEVKAVQGDSIVLADGRVLPNKYRTFTHGYAVTSHAAQGKTVDEVLLVVSSRSLPAVHQEQFYVSISRGRERCQILTDDSDLLRLHVTRSSARLAAVEAMPVIHRRNFIQTILQRGNRFLKNFRLRITQQQAVSPDKDAQHIESSPYEHQRKSARRISF
jgi:ATP-dependent exoDNAse (exonuclease V) alpha subunit